ncbi:SDR family oxidoreductase [Verticiella sediminum]|uniref:SDR family oxidoreductase n=1 Tax=Verticiella sediminum TaxID=1247510 RepID=A0A556AJI1_9BURK|nr:SDR family NAD(P)-dependent oxidoreductase [Verticiella sediminum]TSH93036.1 SDR family oxidoreductase [Verticiella sediminum]
MTLKLEDKVAVVTGAARGIGRGFALRLARLGCHVVVADVDLHAARQFGEVLDGDTVSDEIAGLGRRSIGVQCDLRRRAEAHSLIEQAIAAFGRVDILVNNAGGAFAPIETSQASRMSDADLSAMFEVNLMATVHCSQAAVPHMRAQGGGNIINVGSTLGLDAAHRGGLYAHYGMAKTGVVQFTRFLAAEVGPDGIRVNCIAPGSTATARVASQAKARGMVNDADTVRIPLRRLATVEDMAGPLEFLATDLSSYVTGQCISVCGGKVLTPS